MKLDAKGKPRRRATDAAALFGLVLRCLPPTSPQYHAAVVVERIGNKLYSMPPQKIERAIAEALEKPITDEERVRADRRAQKWVSNPDVVEAQERAIARASVAADVSLERTMRELARIGYADVREVMSWSKEGVVLVDSAELSDDAAAAVAEVSEVLGKDGAKGVRVKMHSKPEALGVLRQLLAPDKAALALTQNNLNINILVQYEEPRK